MSSRRESRRQSRPSFGFEPLPSFDEPSPLADEVDLKSTGHAIGDYPDKNALVMIEDPERQNRQLSRPPSKARKAFRRATPDSDESADASRGASPSETAEERLFLTLKTHLMPNRPDVSDIRQTPSRGAEDYRHNRRIQNSSESTPRGSGRRRGNKRFGQESDSQIPSKRHRRNTRPSFEPVYVPEGTADSLPSSSSQKRGPKRVESADPGSTKSKIITTNEETNRDDDAVAKGRNRKKIKSDAGTEGSNATEKELVNNDFCSSCGGTGDLLCCETCIRSFHFSCVEPPVMDVDELPDGPWSCRHCEPRLFNEDEKNEISGTLFSMLILSTQSQNAVAYQLPTNLREMFAHVQTSKYGEYVDEFMKSDNVAPGPRIQDKAGNTLLCYKCNGTGLNGKSFAVCSKCHEAWHIDCLDPPLESTPLGYWVCPLHVDDRNGTVDLPLRVTKPFITPVALRRQIANDGDIEVADDEDDDDENDVTDDNNQSGSRRKNNAEAPMTNGRISAGDFSDEETVKTIQSATQTRMLPDESIVAKGGRHRPRGFELDRVVYKLSPRTIKLDFVEAAHKLRREPYHETPTSEFALGLDMLASRPDPEREAVRNLMGLKLQGPAVDSASAKENIRVLVDAALNDEDEIGQFAAIKKLMKERGRDRLIELLSEST